METLIESKQSKHEQISSVIDKGQRVDIIESLDNVRFGRSPKCNDESSKFLFDITVPVNDGRHRMRFEGTPLFLDNMYREIGGSGFAKYATYLTDTRQIGLLEKNVNEQLSRKAKHFMLRGLIGQDGNTTMRALLSTKYKRINDDTIHGLVSKIMDKNTHFKCLGGGSSARRTYVRYVTVEPIIMGDRKLYFGFQWTNSEIGEGYFELELFVCDGYCDNGMVFNSEDIESIRMKHSGKNYVGDTGILSKEHVYGLDYKIARSVEWMISDANIQRLEDMVIGSFEKTFESDVEKDQLIIEAVGKHYKLSEDLITQAVEDFDRSERHAYGLQAAFTSAAQRQPCFDLRDQVDRIGGEIVSKTQDEFDKLIALAA